jgi:hypothetical protein
MCVCVCVHIYIYIGIYVYIYIYIYNTYAYTYTDILQKYAPTYTYRYLYTYVCVYMYVWIFIYVYLRTYIWMYVCVYIPIHIWVGCQTWLASQLFTSGWRRMCSVRVLGQQLALRSPAIACPLPSPSFLSRIARSEKSPFEKAARVCSGIFHRSIISSLESLSWVIFCHGFGPSFSVTVRLSGSFRVWECISKLQPGRCPWLRNDFLLRDGCLPNTIFFWKTAVFLEKHIPNSSSTNSASSPSAKTALCSP